MWSGEGLPPTLGGFPSLLAGRGLITDPLPPEGLIIVDTPPPAVQGDGGGPGAVQDEEPQAVGKSVLAHGETLPGRGLLGRGGGRGDRKARQRRGQDAETAHHAGPPCRAGWHTGQK